MKNLGLLNPEKVTEAEVAGYAVREAVRAVVTDGEGKVALLHVSKNDYYKLPGGGLENGEDKIEGLRRECREEIGCEVEITSEIGLITEWQKKYKLKQISYCYLAKVKGEKGQPRSVTDKEATGGLKVVWLTYTEAKQALTESRPDYEVQDYILPRDRAILAAAQLG